MSLVLEKPDFRKDEDQFRGKRERELINAFVYATYINATYTYNAINPKFKASSPLQWLCSSVWTWSESPKTRFLRTSLIW